jgi:integrase
MLDGARRELHRELVRQPLSHAVDPVRKTLQIERAVDNTGAVKHTKTHESRVVDLSPRLVAALNALQASLEAEALLAGKDGLIPWMFATSTGRPVTPKRTARVFRSVLKAAGLAAFNLYSLRHTYASHLLAESAPLPYVSAMLGHRKPTTTLLYYAHAMPKVDRRFIEHLEQVRALGKAAARTHRRPGRRRIQAG